jgi:glycerophosphoryl diester phosphodiesterase
MQLLAHRGFWHQPAEKNTKQANVKAFEHGWGIETDIRDFDAQLVISHDIAKSADYTVAELLQQYNDAKSKSTLALNIKADGCSDALLAILQANNIENYFVFDMSIPETLRYLKLNMNVFIRYSEYERANEKLYAQSKGIWLDIFEGLWFDENFVNSHLSKGKQIAFVSSELHGRDYTALWAMILQNNWHTNHLCMLCTDLPTEAKTYFDL